MGMNKNDNLECNISYDDDNDDLFYAEMKKQILVLTADDEDQVLDSRISTFNRSDREQSTRKFSCGLPPGSYFSWRENQDSDAVPTWLVNLWRNNSSCNGTGVFIPQIVKSRRRYRPGRMNQARSRVYKQVEQAINCI